MDKINVLGNEIAYYRNKSEKYISLTDMAKRFGDDTLIYSWMRNRNTLEFIGIWEELYNPGFNSNGFVTFKSQAGLNSFNLTPRKWIQATNAVGIVSKSGRYGGGTYAHRDIAFEFASWLSPAFKLYLIKEFQRLKEAETCQLRVNWNIQRILAKINYRIHTDAIKDRLIPPELTKTQIDIVYAAEADILNMALFGKTAQQWRAENPGLKGNIRDHAEIEQLVVLSNLESLNAVFIRQGLPSGKRLQQLNGIAITQMRSLIENKYLKKLQVKERPAIYAVV